MTGADLKRIRQELGLSALAMGRLLGYEGSSATTRATYYNMARSVRPIPSYRAKILELTLAARKDRCKVLGS